MVAWFSFSCFLKNNSRRDLTRRWQLKVKLIGKLKGRQEFHLHTTGFEVPRPQNGGIVFKFRLQQEQNTT